MANTEIHAILTAHILCIILLFKITAFKTKNVHSVKVVAFIENSSLRFYYSLYLAYSARLVSFAKFPSVSKKLAKSLDVNVAIFE